MFTDNESPVDRAPIRLKCRHDLEARSSISGDSECGFPEITQGKSAGNNPRLFLKLALGQ